MRRSPMLGTLGVFLALVVSVATSTAAHADQRDFTLVNSTGNLVITHVYVSPSDVNDWGEGLLDRDVLPPGENVFIYFTRFDPSACLYDIKVLAENGGEGVLSQVNLCEVDTVTFS